MPRETREQRQQRRVSQMEQRQREEAAHLQRALQRQLNNHNNLGRHGLFNVRIGIHVWAMNKFVFILLFSGLYLAVTRPECANSHDGRDAQVEQATLGIYCFFLQPLWPFQCVSPLKPFMANISELDDSCSSGSSNSTTKPFWLSHCDSGPKGTSELYDLSSLIDS
jgi:hypothetical protein